MNVYGPECLPAALTGIGNVLQYWQEKSVMEIWNARSLDNNQRFIAAIIAGLVSALVLGLAYGIIYSVFRVAMSVLYIGIGYGVGQAVRKFGRGVHRRFAVVGALMTLLAIIIGDVTAIVGFPGIFAWIVRPALWGQLFRGWIIMNFSTSINSLLGLLLRAIGIYFGYTQSVIF